MRKGTVIIFLLALSLQMKAQKPYSASQEAFLDYIAFINECSFAINESLHCLESFYKESEQYKQGKISAINSEDFLCIPQATDKKLNSAIKLSRNIQSARTHEINQQSKKLWDEYIVITDTYRALTTYVKKRNYASDGFKQSNSLIRDLQAQYLQFSSTQSELSAEIANVHNITQPLLANAYHKAAEQMTAFLNKERLFLETWGNNFDLTFTKSSQKVALDKNIRELSLFLEEFTYGPYIRKPLDQPYRGFIQIALEMIETKKKVLEKLQYGEEGKQPFKRGLFSTLMEHFNAGLLSHYNTYVEECVKKDYNFIPAAAFVTTFSAKPKSYSIPEPTNKEIVFATTGDPAIGNKISTPPQKNNSDTKVKQKKSPRRRKNASTPEKNPSPISSYHPEGLIDALNDHILFLNQIVFSTRKLQHSLESYSFYAKYFEGIDFKVYDTGGGMDYEYGKKVVPTRAYLKASQSISKIPLKNRDVLAGYVEEILGIMYELEDLDEELKQYVDKQQFKKDNLQESRRIIKRFTELFEKLELRKSEADALIRKIYGDYNIRNRESSWIQSSKSLRYLLEEAHRDLELLKQQFKGEANGRPNTGTLNQMAGQLTRGQENLMRGIDRLGELNEKCPYNPYERIVESAQALSNEINILSKNIKDDHHSYARFVFHYNEMVSDYNLFSDLASDKLLDQTLELYLISIETPEQQIVAGPVLAPPSQTDATTMHGFAANNMVLLLDVSASMNGRNKIGLLKESFTKLIPILRQEDEVSIVIYSGRAKTVLEATSLTEKEKVKDAIKTLKSGGKSNAVDGIKLAYEVAKNNFIHGGNNRIIMATDGDILLSNSSLKLAEDYAKQDIYLSVFNFGKVQKQEKLERLAASGNGTYNFVNKENSDLIMLKEAKAVRIQ